MHWQCRNHTFDFSDNRALIMGVLNITPDSFSDAGQFMVRETAIKHALDMVAAGAEIIDVGGESSRPGAAQVPLDEELSRVVPIVAALNLQRSEPNAPRFAISVDTTKAEVARQSIDAGADIINDISACRFEPRILSIVARTGAGLVLMHMQGTPQTMQVAPNYANVMSDVTEFLRERMVSAHAAGIAPDRIAIDPGIGFGKTLEHNLTLLARVEELKSLDRPVLLGTSRKGFIGKLLGREVTDRLAGSLATVVWCVSHGANIVRVHDVAHTAQALRLVQELEKLKPTKSAPTKEFPTEQDYTGSTR